MKDGFWAGENKINNSSHKINSVGIIWGILGLRYPHDTSLTHSDPTQLGFKGSESKGFREHKLWFEFILNPFFGNRIIVFYYSFGVQMSQSLYIRGLEIAKTATGFKHFYAVCALTHFYCKRMCFNSNLLWFNLFSYNS